MNYTQEQCDVMNAEKEKEDVLKAPKFTNPDVPLTSTTIGCFLNGAKRLYTYQCQRPVEVGDRVNVKLPHGGIVTITVQEVHPTPQLSDKWETKWAVVVQTKAQWEVEQNQGSDLGRELGL